MKRKKDINQFEDKKLSSRKRNGLSCVYQAKNVLPVDLPVKYTGSGGKNSGAPTGQATLSCGSRVPGLNSSAFNRKNGRKICTDSGTFGSAHNSRAVVTFLPAKTRALLLLRWHSWIARPPPKGQVAGSNPARSATFQTTDQ